MYKMKPVRLVEKFSDRSYDILWHFLSLGTCPKRRDKIESDLNDTFQEMMDQEFTIEQAYSTLVSARPSKILSGWTFEYKPKPLRSSRTAGNFLETDVSVYSKVFLLHSKY